jgi:hypothetical protein
MNDSDAMIAIQQELDGVEWSTQPLDRIATIMLSAGYPIRDSDGVDLDAEEMAYATS